MAKFVLIYNGGKPPSNEEEKDRVMAAWGQWFESLGEALVDGGNPLGPPKSIGGEATEAASGYSILQAGDQDAAVELAKGNPMTREDGTRIDVYEAFPM
ncbi:MAG: YciI family protein [bacterium]